MFLATNSLNLLRIIVDYCSVGFYSFSATMSLKTIETEWSLAQEPKAG